MSFEGLLNSPSLFENSETLLSAISIGKWPPKATVWGDTVHVPEVQTAFPEAGMAFDTDLAVAVSARKPMFDRVAADDVLIAGMHLHFPAFSRLRRRADGYALYPEAWVHTPDAPPIK